MKSKIIFKSSLALAGVTSYPFVMAVCAVLSLLGALLTHTCVGAEGTIEDQNHLALNTPAISSGGTGASDCTVSLMHSQGLNGSDDSPRHTNINTPHQSSDCITADSGIDEEAAIGPSDISLHDE